MTAHSFTPITLSDPVSVLMPVYNESDVIRCVLDEWLHDVFAFLPKGSEFVFDDCSNDGTEAILLEYAEKHPFMRINHIAKPDGFLKSARRLYAASVCPLVFFTDSDGQYIASDFWTVAAEISDHDMVHGYKARRKDPLYRLVASGAFNFVCRAHLASVGHDVNSAFRLIRRRALEWVSPRLRCMPTLLNAEMYLRLEWEGFRLKDVPIRHRFRKFDKSRGLPLKTFPVECMKAFNGLLELKRELVAES